VWIVIICFESTDMFSSRNTGSMLYSLLTHIFGPINLYDFLIFHHYLRKTGHVIGYGMLALLLLRGWRATFHYAVDKMRLVLSLSWLGTAFVAAMDEWHQSFIPSRTGTVEDVVLDSTAGLLFLLIAYFWLNRVSGTEQLA
jgi:VanZ family protein